MAKKIVYNPFTNNFDLVLGIENPLQFKGSISVASDFPTSSEVENGWFYTITSDVTDNDPTKTNTGQNFNSGDEIAWDGSSWVNIGFSEFIDKGTTNGQLIYWDGNKWTYIDELNWDTAKKVVIYDANRIINDLHHLVDKKYVDEAVTALNARYYMLDTDSGISDYKLTQEEAPSESETSLSFSSVSDEQYLKGWISPTTGNPSKLIAGIFNWKITAEKTSGTKDLRLYWELVERKADNSEVVIGTSSLTDEIDGKGTYSAPIVLSEDYEIASDSYIVGKIYASVSGGGNNPSVKIYYMGETASHWQIPLNTEIFNNLYVNKDGDTMTGDLNVPNLYVSGEIKEKNREVLRYNLLLS